MGLPRLHRPYLYDRFFFVTGNLLRSRTRLEESDFGRLQRGLVKSPGEWKWSSMAEYAGVIPEEQERRCGLRVDRVRLPDDVKTSI